MLDIRYPIGLLFTLYGLILIVFGFFSDKNIYSIHSLGININLGWGGVMLIFGSLMLLFARLRRRKQ
jgi:hypothetical protein